MTESAESTEVPGSRPPLQSATARLFTRIGKRDDDLATQEGRMDELRAYSREHARWRAYRTFCQFRFGYFAFLVLMIIVMFSFTLLMEIFFAIFLPSAKYDDNYVARSIALLVALPIVLFVLSYCFEEANRLFFDAIDKTDGSLPNFRIALAVVIHYARHRHEMQDPRAEAQSCSDGEATSTHDDSTEPGARRNTLLLMTPADDPFDDTGKDEEDLAWELRQEKAEDDAAAAAAEPADVPVRKPFVTNAAAKRWKRIRAAVFAARLIKKVEYDGPPFDVSTFVIVDVICPVLFEVATAVALVLEFLTSWSPTRAFLAYVQMGFWTLSLYLVVWVATHFVSSRNAKMRLLVSNYRRSRRLTMRAVYELERRKRAEHLWLLDVGFRFYYHIAQKVNPGTWCPSRVRHNTAERTAQTTTTTLTTSTSNNMVQPVTIIDVQSPGGRAHKGRHSPVRAAMASKVSAVVTAHAHLQSRNPWHHLANTRKAAVLLVLVIAAALLSLYSFVVGWPIMGVLLIALSSVIQQLFPQIFGSAFRDFIKAFVVLSFVFFSSTFVIGAFASGESFVLGPFVTSATDPADTPALSKTNALTLGLQHQSTSEYPACTIDYDGLTVLDLALIADAAYGNSTAVQQHALANRFSGTALDNWTYVARNNESTDHQVWMELYFPSVNMTVVAVRGTASATDALEDLHYWFGITIMQALDVFVPFLRQLPHAFVVKLLSMDLITSVMPAPVYVPLLEHVERVRSRVGDNVVVTGHSLGGAMAAMVGAKTQTRAVSFSGPGLIYSRGRFGVDASDLRDYVLTFKPRKDVVPRVDVLGGMVQELRCKHKSPMACHGTLTHICELYLACGDSRKRNWTTNKQCNAYRALPEDTEEDV